MAVEGFAVLADALEVSIAGADDARTRLRACGEAYVATAQANPGHYAVMLDESIHDPEDDALQTEGMRAFAVLVSVIEDVRDEVNPALDVDAAATLCWAAMHGLVGLDAAMTGIAERLDAPIADIGTRIARLTDLMFDGFAQR